MFWAVADWKGGSNSSGHLLEVIQHCQSSEYVTELLPGDTIREIKRLSMLHTPNGVSFSDGILVDWQKWRMRVTFNSRTISGIRDEVSCTG